MLKSLFIEAIDGDEDWEIMPIIQDICSVLITFNEIVFQYIPRKLNKASRSFIAKFSFDQTRDFAWIDSFPDWSSAELVVV